MSESPLSDRNPAPSVCPDETGVVVALDDHVLLLEVCAANIVRVACAPDAAYFARRSYVVLPRKAARPPFTVEAGDATVVLRTDELVVRVDRASGTVTFVDAVTGAVILKERAGGRTFTPRVEQGENTLAVRQQWEPAADDEALYGLGQHQFGQMNIRGRDIDLWQRNTVIAVPAFVSSRGYGILWDQNARTRYGDIRELELLPAARMIDASGQPGALTATYFADGDFRQAVETRRETAIDIAIPATEREPHRSLHPAFGEAGAVSVRWEGALVADESGEHTLQPFFSSGLKIWIEDELVVDHWRQGWLNWYDQARVKFVAGQPRRIRIEWLVNQGTPTFRLLWKTPTREIATALWTGVAEGIDYYFVHGPALDRVVAGFRQLTGTAPMMPVWAFGLWQSRERYATAEQSIEVLTRYRALGVPIDNIVQDWLYWRKEEWGSHEFDPERFPDPDAWIRAIHEKFHARLMLSAWSKFYTGTANFEAMRSRGFLYEPNLREGTKDWLGYTFSFYDAFNAEARELYWQQLKGPLFDRGVDAWWMDATEPEMRDAPSYEDIRDSMQPTAAGTSSRVMLAYPLLHNEGIYQHQRAAAPDQRVFILTRSGFTGMQRTAAACWSGDISATWTALRKQIPAGLSIGLSGIPYWTTDSGGFSVPPRWAGRDQHSSTPDAAVMEPEAAAEWAELNVRWLQYAAFCPLMRIHGQFPFREMWEFGGEDSPAFRAMVAIDRLRYRLLPYLYSVAGSVTHEHGTLMRALVMDFPHDAIARECGDEFMFGPALLVTPVTTYQARTQTVYLPKTPGGWYCGWTGEALPAGRVVTAPAPYERIPLHVRAGSIVLLGPDQQHTAEKPADPITVLVYAGADGAFTLYEDDGLSYGYERGASARIAFRWDDATRTLTIGARIGTFPGMLAERRFEVVLVSRENAAGFTRAPESFEVVRYEGSSVDVRL